MAMATGPMITVEEQDVAGGLGGAVAEFLGERCLRPLVGLGIRDHFGESGSNDDLLDKYRLSSQRVAEDIEAIMRARPRVPSVSDVVGRECPRDEGP